MTKPKHTGLFAHAIILIAYLFMSFGTNAMEVLFWPALNQISESRIIIKPDFLPNIKDDKTRLEKLVIECPENITTSTDLNECSSNIGFGLNLKILSGNLTRLTWEMTGATIDASLVSGINQIGNHVFNTGTTIITCSAGDNSEIIQCSFTISVIDNQPPVVKAPPDIIIKCNERIPSPHTTLQAFLNAGGTANDNCGLLPAGFEMSYEVKDNRTCPYTITRTYQVADINGNISMVKQRIIVTDEDGRAYDSKEILSETIATASITKNDISCRDDNNGSIQLNVNGASGVLSYFWSTRNGRGIQQGQKDQSFLSEGDYNVNVYENGFFLMKLNASIMVTDVEPPVIIAPKNITIHCYENIPPAYTIWLQFERAGGSASDNCQLNYRSFRLYSETKSSQFCPYTITRTYSITDEYGNIGKAEQRIFVEEELMLAEKAPVLKSGMAECTAITGNWNSTTTWSCGTIPTSADNVIIPNGVTVTIDGPAVCNNITIESGGTIDYSGAYALQVNGDWTNNGTYDGGTTGIVEFTGTNPAAVNGNTTFEELIISKGNLNTTLTVNGTNSVGGGGSLTMNSGLVTIPAGGTFTVNPAIGLDIESAAGFDVTGGTLTTGNFTITNEGLIRVSSGSANLGAGSGNEVHTQFDGAFIVSGGSVNIAGRLYNSASGTLDPLGLSSGIHISGGIVTLATVGNGLSNVGSLNVTANGTFDFSGGTIVFQNPSNATTELDLGLIDGGGTKNTIGGTFQFGNASTPAGTTFDISSEIPLYNITTGGNANIALQNKLILGNPLTLNGTSTLYLNDNAIQIPVTGNGTYNFPITNGSGNPIPVSVTLSSGTLGANPYIEVTTLNVKHPDNSNSQNYLNRYWTISVNDIAYPDYSVNANYMAGDIANASTNVIAGSYTSGWSEITGATIAVNTVSFNSTSTNLSFTILAKPTVTITNSDPEILCDGSSVTLNTSATGDPAITYLWTSNPVTAIPSNTNPTVAVAPPATPSNAITNYLYMVTVTDGNGFTASDDLHIVVNPLPIVDSPAEICMGDTEPLFPASGGTWTSNNPLVASVTNDGLITGISAGTVTFTFTEIATGCSKTTSGVTVKELPAAPIAGNVLVCYDGNVHNGSAIVGSGEIVVWYDDATGGNLSTAPSGSAVGTYTAYAATQNTATGCESETRTLVTLTINDLPTAPIAGNVLVCYDGNVHNGSAIVGSGEIVVWYDDATGGNLSTAPSGSAVGTYTAYAATQNTATGCESATRTLVTLIINPLPSPTITGPATVCNGETVIYTTESGMSDYFWTIPFGGTIVNGNGTNSVEVKWNVAGNRSITVNYQNSNGCFASAPTIYAVTVNQTPLQPTVSGVSICYNNQAILTASNAISGQQYLWFDNLGNLLYTSANHLDNTYTTPALTATTQYLVSIINSNTGCESSHSSTTVTVYEVEPGEIAISDVEFCEGENPPAFTSFIDATGNLGTVTYQWERSTDGINYISIIGATYKTYDPPVLPVGNYWYRRSARVKYSSNNYCIVQSNIIQISVYSVPVITSVTTNSPVCETDEIVIAANATNAVGDVTFTLHYESGSYAYHSLPNPSDIVLTVASNGGTASASFSIYPEIGRQTFSVIAVNGDAGACSSNLKTIDVKVFDIPRITVVASCASGTDGILRLYSNLDNANFTGVDIGTTEFMLDNDGYWIEDNIIYNVNTGMHSISGRNTVATTCIISSTLEIKDQTIEGEDYELCQGETIPPGEGLEALSFCFTWIYDQHNFKPEKVCANDNNKKYKAAMPTGPAEYYTAYFNDGTLHKYAVALTFKAPDGEFTVKDASNKPKGTISLYEYPFRPDNPQQNFVAMGTNIYPNGTHFINLDPDAIYVLVLNDDPGDNKVDCIGSWTVSGEKLDVVDDIGGVNWYLNEDDTNPLYPGEIFNPIGYPGSGVEDPAEPGIYTFWAGCGDVDECRQPIQLVINPNSQLVEVTDTICTGSTININLESVWASEPARVVNPDSFKVNYVWQIVPNPGISGALNGSGSAINQTLSVVNPGTCPVQEYIVTPWIGDCEGIPGYIRIMVIDNLNQELPEDPEPITVACIDKVPAALQATITNGCFNITAVPVDVNNGGSGCTNDPFIITRKWSFNDGCSEFSIEQKITVIDDIPPTFTVPEDTEVFTDENCFADISPSNTGDVTDEADNCSTNLEATYVDSDEVICEGSKTITRKWILVDDCGNETAQDQIILITDNVAPVIQTQIGALDGTFQCEEADEVAQILMLEPVATDNCSSPAQITINLISDETTYEDGVCPNKFTRIRKWTFTDECGNESLPFVQTIQVVDLEPPVLVPPPAIGFCVVDVISAFYDGQPNQDADIIASYNPTYEPDPDVLNDRPDYFVLTASDTHLDLDPNIFFSDNCSDVSDLILHWTVTTNAGTPYKDFNGNELTDITGQVSAYLSSNNTEIVFMGATHDVVIYNITYWLEDECGVESEPKTRPVRIQPRPQIIKLN